MEDLIKMLSNIRECSKKDNSINLEITKKQLSMIITSLKMYEAFDSVLDEEIDIKHN